MKQRTELDTSTTSAAGKTETDSGQDLRHRYRAFISYSHEDQAWADWLIKALETYRVPTRLVGTETAVGTVPRRLTPIFRDRDELASASDLGDTIRGALADSASLIVICSPAAANSHWVNEEIRAYQQLGKGRRIFCLIVSGEPNASAIAGQEYKECLAPTLRETRDANNVPVAHFIEPAAADVRPGMDSRATARLKLVAGILGIGLDQLRRRDHQRHIRRLVALTILALVVTATTTTLAITAILARRTAEVAKQTAERRQKQAEGLVDFMLGDLNDKLRQVNRLDILQSVDDRAMAYFASLPVADVTDQSLALRAKALEKIGSVRLDQGHTKKALDAFQLATFINRKRMGPGTPSVEILTDYGGSLTWLGKAYWDLQESARAENSFRLAQSILSQALAQDPRNTKTKLQLAYSMNNLASILNIRGKPRQALAMFRQQISLLQELHEAQPDNVEYTQSLAITSINVATLDFEQGQLIDSIRAQITPNRVLSTMVGKERLNRAAQGTLLLSLANTADSLRAAGQQRRAIDYLKTTTQIADSLTRFDPKHADWQQYRIAYRTQLTLWQVEAEPDSTSTRSRLKQLDSDLRSMRKGSDDKSSIDRWLAQVQLAFADIAERTGQRQLAILHARRALANVAPLVKNTPSNAKNIRVACAAEMFLARLHAPSSTEHAEHSLDLIQAIAKDSANPSNLSLWVEALLQNGQRAQAMKVLSTLSAMGYQTAPFKRSLARQHVEYSIDPDTKAHLEAVLDKVPPPPSLPKHQPQSTASIHP